MMMGKARWWGEKKGSRGLLVRQKVCEQVAEDFGGGKQRDHRERSPFYGRV
jgi:hypothetical protein